jgi:hypothetical protein
MLTAFPALLEFDFQPGDRPVLASLEKRKTFRSRSNSYDPQKRQRAMEQHQHDRTSHTEPAEEFNFMVERRKFLRNVEALRKTSDETFAILRELECLSEELAVTRAEIDSLEANINSTAEKFGLQPISTKRTGQ